MIGSALLQFLKDAAKRLLSGCASRGGNHRHMLIEERLSLGAKKTLLYVTCDERRFLIAAGAEEIAGMIPLDPPGASQDRRVPIVGPSSFAAASRARVQ